MAHPHRALLDLAAGREAHAIEDPDALLLSATEHGMAGLVWSQVATGAIALPAEHTFQLAAADAACRERRLALLSASEHVATILEGCGLRFVTFKGVAFEQRWYDRMGERPSVDVDILLAPDDLPRFGEAVAALDPTYGLRRGLERRISSGMQQGATVRVDGVPVDLHVEVPKLLVPSRGRELVWHQRTEVPFANASVPALDAEAELFALFTSLLKDRFSRLIKFVDGVHLVERADLDWDVVRRLAAADRLDGLLSVALGKVFTTLDRPQPVVGAHRRLWSVTWSILSRPEATLTAPRLRPRRLLLVPLAIPGRRTEALRLLLRRTLPSRADARTCTALVRPTRCGVCSGPASEALGAPAIPNRPGSRSPPAWI